MTAPAGDELVTVPRKQLEDLERRVALIERALHEAAAAEPREDPLTAGFLRYVASDVEAPRDPIPAGDDDE